MLVFSLQVISDSKFWKPTKILPWLVSLMLQLKPDNTFGDVLDTSYWWAVSYDTAESHMYVMDTTQKRRKGKETYASLFTSYTPLFAVSQIQVTYNGWEVTTIQLQGGRFTWGLPLASPLPTHCLRWATEVSVVPATTVRWWDYLTMIYILYPHLTD